MISEKEIEEYINSLRSSAVSEEYYSEEWEEGFEDGVRWLEKQLENKQWVKVANKDQQIKKNTTTTGNKSLVKTKKRKRNELL